ncbi:MAG: hypothetical protein WKG00_10205 [Polyangiaceae bacterium]
MEREAESRSAFDSGRQAAEANRWAEACPWFQKAHDLHGTNGTAFQLARCYDAVGRTDLARVYYAYVLEHADRDSVAERVERSRQRVGEIDAAPLARATPAPVRSAAALVPSAASTFTAPVPRPDDRSGSAKPAAAAFAIGGVGLGVGAILGILALSQASEVKGACDASGSCPPEREADADEAVAKGWGSVAALGVGMTGVVVGVVLLATRRTPQPALSSRGGSKIVISF